MKPQTLYGVEYTLLDPLPARLVAMEPLLIELQLRNTGLIPWLATGYPVMLVARWTTLDGMVVQEMPWQPIPRSVPCGDAITIELRLIAPVVAGEYVLTIELVEYMIAWFRERGVTPWSSPMTVEPSRNPRITVINGNCLANDAVGNHVAMQVRALAEAGFHPLLLTGFIDDRLPRSLRRFMVPVELRQILEPDAYSAPVAEHFRRSAVVIVNYPIYYELVELIREARAPVLFDYHGVTPPAIWGTGQPGYEDVARGVANLNLVQFADYAVAHSQYMVDELVATGLIAPSRTSVLPYPVTRDAAYAQSPDPQLQQQYGLAGKQVLLYVGRMARNKRIHVLVEALPLIRARYPETVLLLVGETRHVYAGYVAEVKARAAELGVADAVIFTGLQNRDQIASFYQLCDVFVMASIHEGFCMPVIEAMSLGKPVVAAAATALPSTVGDAGLLFTPDDHEDLARQVLRVLAARQEPPPDPLDGVQAQRILRNRPIAFVTPRYGRDVLGGAERGAQAWAEQLAARGFTVKALTTNAVDLVGWGTAPLPEIEVINGVTVRRFAVDPIDPSGFHDVQMKAARGEVITRRDEEQFMQHNLRSRALEEYIARHREEYAAFIFTPYLFGTTYYAAKQAGDRAFHIPCLHDEPAAQFAVFREMLEEARGILFNTAAEERLARGKLRLANPFSTVLGYGFPDEPLRGDPARFRERTGISSPFLLYSGRLEEAKNVRLLVEWFIAYKTAHPDSDVKLALAGKGDLSIPDRPDIVRLGMIVDRQELADAYAAALALCQLSLNESFSIVMMEAWQQGRPVIVHADCAVTREHVERSGGGYVCESAASFGAAVDQLLADPEMAAALGEQGRAYVQANFGWSVLVDRMILALATFLQPRSLVTELAQRGIRRSLDFTYAHFEAHLIGLIQHLCNQSVGWQLFEQVQGRLAALANGNGAFANDHESAPVMARARRWVNRLRHRSHPSAERPPVNGHHHNQHAVMRLVTELLDLLAHTRRAQRRLERELALLRDRMAIEKQNAP